MKVLAIDPDTHTTGIVVASEREVHLAYCLAIKDALKGRDAVVEMCKALWCAMGPLIARAGGGIELVCVEGQRIYVGRTKNPESILMLGQVAGAAFTAAMTYAVQPNAIFPYPQEWKGDLDKVVSQSRAYAHYGWPYLVSKSKRDSYAYPTFAGAEELDSGERLPSKAQWKHVGDALALALWAATKHNERSARAERVRDPELNAVLGRRGHS